MYKPIIFFCEPFELLVLTNENKEIYLQEIKMNENELLNKYDIDYDSFYCSNIRDKNGYPEILKSKYDVHIFILGYLND